MSKTLQQIIGGENLTGVIQSVQGGVPTDLIPPAMLTPSRTIDGDKGTYNKVQATRKLARRKPYGAKAGEAEKQGIDEVPFVAIHTVESHRHKATTLVNLRAEGDLAKQRLGEQTVARQTGEFGRLFQNLRAAAIYSTLANGAIWFDGEGNLLPSATGAKVTIDFGVPAGNKGQLDVFGDGAIIDTSWSNPAAKIITDIGQIRKAARKLTGLVPNIAYYGENIPDYMLTNDQTKELINRHEQPAAAFQAGTIPNGFLGISEWRPWDQAFFEDSAGNNQDFVGEDTLILTPTVSGDWYEMVEGTYPVPTTIGMGGMEAADALSNFAIQAGRFSYAKVEDDPPSIKQVAGDTFMPLLNNPHAIFIADVTP